jgi:peroxiredoxin
VGDAAPPWEMLPGVDGKTYSLSDFRNAKAVVVIFACNHCPVVQACEDRIKQLAADFKDRGVAVAAISVSRFAQDSFEKMQARAQERGYNFPYLHDPSQNSGRRYGATATPQVFVLNGARKIVYMGAFDDSWEDAADVKEPFTRLAVEAVLAGKSPEITETRPVGCTIEYAPQ